MDGDFGRAALASELTCGDEPPREVLLIPAGEIPTRPHDGRAPWRNTDPEAVVRATRELALDLPIDYEHQGERSRENGQPAPAAGWIRRVFDRAGAVWGEVEWTERAASMLQAREYRFLSPVFSFDRRTRQVRRLLGAALTNDPAMYMRAIATAQRGGDMDMPLLTIREALGLSADAGEDRVLEAAKAAAAAAHELAQTRKALGLAEDAPGALVTATATALVAGRKAVARAAGLEAGAAFDAIEGAVRTAAGAGASDPDPSKFVPRAEFDSLRARLDTLETTGAESRATAAVDAAIKAGKVTPASRTWALGYARKDPEGFAAYASAAPTILADGRVAPATPQGGDAERLTDAERAVCRATGVSEKDFVASKQALDGETEGS